MQSPTPSSSLQRLAPLLLAMCLAVPLHATPGDAAPRPGAAPGAALRVVGTIYVDRDGDGTRDGDEDGIAGVAVSNGRDVVRSGADGRYAITLADGQAVFLVKPRGYRAPLGADGLPRFWWRPEMAPAAARPVDVLHEDRQPLAAMVVDFALLEADSDAGERPLDVLVMADPQVKSMRDVDHYARDIVAPLIADGRGADGDRPADLGITLGDVVDDVLALYPSINAVTARFGVPWLHVAGNHDLDPTAADDAAAFAVFRATYGPGTFAWEDGAAAFVLLDNVVPLPGERPAYVGGLRPSQFAFLEAYLATLPPGRLLVLALHVPLFDTAPPGRADTFRAADRARLFRLLERVPRVLVLSGHRHTQRHVRHGADSGWRGATPLHEYSVGAASGAFWSGAPDAEGIPDATMADGTPNGVARLRVAADASYALEWMPARLRGGDPARTAAMSLHAPRVLRRGAYPAWAVYANVYMGEHDTRVEYRVSGGAWRAMARVDRPDPWLLAENARDDAAPALRGFDRSPEAEPSTHLWRGALPTDLDAGAHTIEVRAFDRWQGEQHASTQYRLEVAAP